MDSPVRLLTSTSYNIRFFHIHWTYVCLQTPIFFSFFSLSFIIYIYFLFSFFCFFCFLLSLKLIQIIFRKYYNISCVSFLYSRFLYSFSPTLIVRKVWVSVCVCLISIDFLSVERKEEIVSVCMRVWKSILLPICIYKMIWNRPDQIGYLILYSGW